MRQAFFQRAPELMPLGRLLPRAGDAVSRYLQRMLAEHDLTPTSLGVLGVLDHRTGLSHRELAGHLGLTPATLTPVVDALEAARELRRDRDRLDRRVVRLTITAFGREHLRRAFAEVDAGMRARMPQPRPEHTEIIRSYLLAVLAAVADGEEPR